jgi:NAD(P)-dependent dehydrogenase (short-subunit alcohol dehydrogenase family)
VQRIARHAQAGVPTTTGLFSLTARPASVSIRTRIVLVTGANRGIGEALVDALVATTGDVPVLVNNVGVAGHMGGAFTDADGISKGRTEMEVNVFGPCARTQAFAPVLARM